MTFNRHGTVVTVRYSLTVTLGREVTHELPLTSSGIAPLKDETRSKITIHIQYSQYPKFMPIVDFQWVCHFSKSQITTANILVSKFCRKSYNRPLTPFHRNVPWCNNYSTHIRPSIPVQRFINSQLSEFIYMLVVRTIRIKLVTASVVVVAFAVVVVVARGLRPGLHHFNFGQWWIWSLGLSILFSWKYF